MATHKIPVVKIAEVLSHPNADRLEIVKIFGYQVVVRKGEFKVGDLGVYIPPDSIVPRTSLFEWLWEARDNQIASSFSGRITVRRFRKEWSEGLLIPLKETYPQIGPGPKPYGWGEGDDLSDELGITHYNPPEPEIKKQYHDFNKGVYPRSLRGWYHWFLWKIGIGEKYTSGYGNMPAPGNYPPVYDVEAYKKFVGIFEEGEEIVITEKIHGSNARFTYQDGKMYAGSRQFWKQSGSKTVWREALIQNPWIQTWCEANPNYTLYGEVVPTQKYKYGCAGNEIKVFIFDIRTPEGKWIPYEEIYRAGYPPPELKWVPVLYKGPFNEALLNEYVDGASRISGAGHLREGIVIRPTVEREVRELGRLQLKITSNLFLENE